MGAQWKQKGRELEAHKKGQVVGKIVREIMVAAKLGGAEPELNARLAAALDKARKASVTKDTIERAIKKGAGLTDEKIEYETVVYEGFAPHKVPVLVECLTDNRNRTAPEIRNLFKTGQLGQPGSMNFFFDRWGVVEATHPDGTRDRESDAIEAGAQNVEEFDEDVPEGGIGARFLTEIKDLAVVAGWLKKAGWKIAASELRHVAKNPVELPEPQRQEAVAFLTALDDHDDVHHVFAGLK
ncbi:MAG: YebC/PmpR family DNA-binding transcriptional regulator [Verrucomicrobiota bacterium]